MNILDLSAVRIEPLEHENVRALDFAAKMIAVAAERLGVDPEGCAESIELAMRWLRYVEPVEL